MGMADTNKVARDKLGESLYTYLCLPESESDALFSVGSRGAPICGCSTAQKETVAFWSGPARSANFGAWTVLLQNPSSK